MHLDALLRQSADDGQTFSKRSAEDADRRESQRRRLTLSAFTNIPRGGGFPVVIRDISQGGLLLEGHASVLSMGDVIEIDLPDRGPVSAKVVWKSAKFSGCQFEKAVSTSAVSAALLKSDPQASDDTSLQTSKANAKNIWPERNFATALMFALFIWAALGAIANLILM